MENERLYYVDWLRVLVILTLIPYHSALTYTPLGDVYIKAPITDISILPFLVFTAPLDNFFMTLLFFLAGVGAYYSLKRRGPERYLGERSNKLLWPLFFGMLTICPLQAYFQAMYEGFTGGYLHFLPLFYSTKIVHYHGYAHLWFLVYLFFFSAVSLPLFTRWLNEPARLERITGFLGRGGNIFIPLAFIVLIETVLRPFVNGVYIIWGDWANDIVYLSFFVFGFVFAFDSGLRERIRRLGKTAAAGVILCIPILIASYCAWSVYSADAVALVVVWAFTKGVYECAVIILLLTLGEKYLNKKSKALTYLSRASFSYYFWHFTPVCLFTWLLVGTNLNMYIKYLLTVGMSSIFILVIYEFVIRRFYPQISNLVIGLRQ